MSKPKYKKGDKVILSGHLCEIEDIVEIIYKYAVKIPGHQQSYNYPEASLTSPKKLPKYNTGDIVRLKRGKVLREIIRIFYNSYYNAGNGEPVYILKGRSESYTEDKFELVMPTI